MPEYRIGDKVVYYGETYEIEDVKLSPMYKLQLTPERDTWVREDEVKPTVKVVPTEVLCRIIEFVRGDYDNLADANAVRTEIEKMDGFPKDGWKLINLLNLIMGIDYGMRKDISIRELVEVLNKLNWRVEP